MQIGDYYVSVTETDKSESARLELTVTSYPGVSALRWCADGQAATDGVGTGTTAQLYAAIRFTPEDLAQFDGKELHGVSFVSHSITDGEMTFVIKAWTGGSYDGRAFSEGTEVVSKTVDTVTIGSWNSILFDTPLTIDATEELWIGYSCNLTGTGYPLGGYDCTENVYKTGIIKMAGGEWGTLASYSMDYGFCIAGITSDITPPTLTAGAVTRNSHTSGTVKFTSSEQGAYYYEVVADGADIPTIYTNGTGDSCNLTEMIIDLDGVLTEGAKDIYIVVKDEANNVSASTFKIAIPAYVVATHTVAVNGSYAGTAGEGNYAPNDTVTINAGTRSNYTFNGWTTASSGVVFDNASGATTRFSMPSNAVTVTANWTYNGGGTSGGGGGGVPTYSVVKADETKALENAGQGTAKLSTTAAKTGDKVTVTIAPEVIL